MNKAIETVLTVVIAVCAIVMTGLAITRSRAPANATPGTPVRRIKPTPDLYASQNRLGPTTAPVVLVEFADFQCPYCSKIRPRLELIMADADGKVAVLFRHYPLPQHSHAMPAAIAAECAADQGRFAQYHDVLFSTQDSIGTIPWTVFAARANVADTTVFRRCLDTDAVRARVMRDTLVGTKLGIRGTPALVVGNQMFTGVPPEAVLEDAVRAELVRTNAQEAKQTTAKPQKR